MLRIYKHEGKITHIAFNIGKSWISIDKSGVMGWNNITKKNFFWIFSATKTRAF